MTSASPKPERSRGPGALSRENRTARAETGEQSAAGASREPKPLRHLRVCPTDRRTQSGLQVPARAQSLPGPPMARDAALPPSKLSPLKLPLLPLLLLLLRETGERPQAPPRRARTHPLPYPQQEGGDDEARPPPFPSPRVGSLRPGEN